jgi:hypothetical protein
MVPPQVVGPTVSPQEVAHRERFVKYRRPMLSIAIGPDGTAYLGVTGGMIALH